MIASQKWNKNITIVRADWMREQNYKTHVRFTEFTYNEYTNTT